MKLLSMKYIVLLLVIISCQRVKQDVKYSMPSIPEGYDTLSVVGNEVLVVNVLQYKLGISVTQISSGVVVRIPDSISLEIKGFKYWKSDRNRKEKCTEITLK